MHILLLNLGFVKQNDGAYINYEINLRVTLTDDNHVLVPTPKGNVPATLEELEDAIISGGFGEF